MKEELISRHTDVSRETLDRLQLYVSLIEKWNPRINLVSKKSLDEIWERHILDSVQIFDLTTPGSRWLDIGSGGGLPGIVVAILAHERASETKVTLMESDQRKCAFLRTAARECGVQAEIVSDRIEQAEPHEADTISARALADLSSLLEFAERHLAPSGTALFPKGANWKKEVEKARQRWRFTMKEIKSLTEPKAVVLKIEGVERV